MQIGNRFRCVEPAPAFAQLLLQWIGCRRFIYDAKVGEDRYFRTFARKSSAHTGEFAPVDQQYRHFKTELTPWLFQEPSQVLRNGALNWKQAYSRHFARLGGRPTIQKKHGAPSVWLTGELCRFVPRAKPSKDCSEHDIEIGSRKNPICQLSFKAERPHRLPHSIHVGIQNGIWHVSVNYDDGVPQPSEKKVAEWLMQFTEAELMAKTQGADRGVGIAVMCSHAAAYGFSKVQEKRLAKQEKHGKRWQRKAARRAKGSKRCQAYVNASKHRQYGVNLRDEQAHQASHAMASDPNSCRRRC